MTTAAQRVTLAARAAALNLAARRARATARGQVVNLATLRSRPAPIGEPAALGDRDVLLVHLGGARWSLRAGPAGREEVLQLTI